MPLTNITFSVNPDHFHNKKRLGKMQGLVYCNGGNIIFDSNYVYTHLDFNVKRFVLVDCNSLLDSIAYTRFGDLFILIGNIPLGEKELLDLIEEKKKIEFIEKLAP
jgi:hypothetical protein